MRVALLLHLLSVVVWIGGMFLAYVAVRPAAAEALEPRLRLGLWNGIFRRFFAWVWAAVLLILGSGSWMMGRMSPVPVHVMAMAGIGIVMTLIFLHAYFAPFARMKRAIAAEDWASGAVALNRIRGLVAMNLALGVLNIGVAVLGFAR